MRTGNKNKFVTLKTEGELLPIDLLQRISSFDKSLEGLSLESYHLNPNERINEAASRSWNRISAAWQSFCKAQKQLSESEIGTTITRERWLLILFQELGYGRLNPAKAIESKGRTYPISHFWENTPIHLVGYKVDIDKKAAGIAGAARTSPHSLVQEFLNSTDKCLWGFVSNGLRLRILRDNLSLTRQAYVEFDLEAMMEGQVYSDFVMLWLLCHQSRVEAEKPKDSWLERWVQTAKDQGTRALENLRIGVENAIKELGAGFLACPLNGKLRENLRTGALPVQDYYRQLLRLVYRLIFLFVAEDRDLLFSPEADNAKKEFYSKYYSASRLRSMAENMRGTKHCDLYHGLRIIMDKLGHNDGCEVLGLSVLGSFLWSEEAIPDLAHNNISNIDLLSAIRSLSFITEGRMFRYVDYRNLGSEELGSVYESLLELQPILNTDVGSFELKTAGGHERKTTGSYYTPSELIHCLLDSALDPVISEAQKSEKPEEALLSLKICDPACGSGHFLIAAAHRLARRLATVRTGDDEPSPEATRSALRDVIGHCIYGVDINPMAVELCKVGLWMEALEPGKPLSFLDHKILCGNSLLGTTPQLLKGGIPDNAFKPIEGDDKKCCQIYKKRNKEERRGQRRLFGADLKPWKQIDNLSKNIELLEEIEDYTIEGVRKKEKKHVEFVKSSEYRIGKFLADVWCSAFVWKKTESSELPYPITEEVFRNIEENPDSAPEWIRAEVQRLAEQYQFFHWHIMFPDVFRVAVDSKESDNQQTGWNGGFDVVLGNPPWERTSFEEIPYFLNRVPYIAEASTMAVRKKMLKELSQKDPPFFLKYLDDKRKVVGEDYFFSNSQNYPYSAKGRANTYALFSELSSNIVNVKGRCGLVIPTGIVTDVPMKTFWNKLCEDKRVASIFDFENRGVYFPDVHRNYKFCLFTLLGLEAIYDKTKYGFFLSSVADTKDETKIYFMSTEEIKVVNPDTKQPPVCRSRKDFDLLLVLQKVGFYLGQLFPAWVGLTSASTSDSWVDISDVAISSDDTLIPLYESKLIHQFDHCFSTYEGVGTEGRNKGSPKFATIQHNRSDHATLTRFMIPKKVVQNHLSHKTNYGNAIAVYRDITNCTNERTLIATIIPFAGIMQPLNGLAGKEAIDILLNVTCLNSFVVDYAARLKTPGTHLNVTICNQLPIINPLLYSQQTYWDSEKTFRDWIVPRSIELIYNSLILKNFARDCNYICPPFRWNEERRFLLRCELDAAYFHLYKIGKNDIDYILETFPIVKRRDEEKYSEYRTKRVILEIYDEMAAAMRAEKHYITRLVPPPADLAVSHNT